MLSVVLWGLRRLTQFVLVSLTLFEKVQWKPDGWACASRTWSLLSPFTADLRSKSSAKSSKSMLDRDSMRTHCGGVDEVFQRTDFGGAMNPVTDALGSTVGLVDTTRILRTTYACTARFW